MFDNKVMIFRDGRLAPLYGLVYLLIGLEQLGLKVAGGVGVCVAVSNLHIELWSRAVKIVVGLGAGDVPVRVRISILLVEMGVGSVVGSVAGSVEVVSIHRSPLLEVRGGVELATHFSNPDCYKVMMEVRLPLSNENCWTTHDGFLKASSLLPTTYSTD